MIHDDMTSFENLFVKYQNLLTENSNLKEEIRILKACLAGVELGIPVGESSEQGGESETPPRQSEAYVSPVDISNKSDSVEKIKLFMSRFMGRDDVYARSWENKKKGTSGYSPSCVNEWKPGVCAKTKGSCAGCAHKEYAALDEAVIDQHLRGKIVR